jgi:cation transport ATPase
VISLAVAAADWVGLVHPEITPPSNFHHLRDTTGIEVAQRSRRIALESVAAGISLSILGMVAAALGYLTPVQGAILQEVIDVAVIVNALRALGIVPKQG